MTLWRLEWLRLLRTRRLLALGVVYAFFGLTGPLTARYLSRILSSLDTSGIKVQFPEPTPADGIAQFVGNTSQICLLVVVLVASSALAFDARREMAVFLRTRVSSVRTIIVPAYAANAAAAIAALVVGAGCAWYETAVLLGTPDTGAMLIGILYAAVALSFAVALVAAVASVVRGVLATAGTALVILILIGIAGGLSGQSRWLPTGLLSALTDLTAGTPANRFLPGLAVTLVLTALSLAVAVVLGDRREV